jgi:hypothetical protein
MIPHLPSHNSLSIIPPPPQPLRWPPKRLSSIALRQGQVSSKQINFVSVSTETKRNLICFGLISDFFLNKKKFRFVSVFIKKTVSKRTETKNRCFETNRNRRLVHFCAMEVDMGMSKGQVHRSEHVHVHGAGHGLRHGHGHRHGHRQTWKWTGH